MELIKASHVEKTMIYVEKKIKNFNFKFLWISFFI